MSEERSKAVAIKVSGDLVQAARIAAEIADRSVTGQIEHWARLGQQAEAHLTVQESLALKRPTALQSTPSSPESSGDRLLSALSKLREGSHFGDFRNRLFEEHEYLFGVDETVPGRLVRVARDGTRTLGRVIDGRFVPES